jgi:hypothetical protein
MIGGRPVWNGSNQPPRGKLSRYKMNVIISQQAAENERSSRLSGVQRESSYLLLSVFSGRKVFKTLEKFSLT